MGLLLLAAHSSATGLCGPPKKQFSNPTFSFSQGGWFRWPLKEEEPGPVQFMKMAVNEHTIIWLQLFCEAYQIKAAKPKSDICVGYHTLWKRIHFYSHCAFWRLFLNLPFNVRVRKKTPCHVSQQNDERGTASPLVCLAIYIAPAFFFCKQVYLTSRATMVLCVDPCLSLYHHRLPFVPLKKGFFHPHTGHMPTGATWVRTAHSWSLRALLGPCFTVPAPLAFHNRNLQSEQADTDLSPQVLLMF